MLNTDDILSAMNGRKAERQKRNIETFLDTAREGFLEMSEDEISKIYTRDKNTTSMKLFKMKSGVFSIKDGDKTLFSSSNLHEAKVEFILYLSLGDPTAMDIMSKL